MNSCRLIGLWEPPAGYRLASIVATTYELQADFLEEDLLPVALDLRLPPGRGREFRMELEHALQEVEVSVFFHPGRYQPGQRHTPRVDLIPLPEGRYPKLHAKLTLLRFVMSGAPEASRQIVRLVVGSANLTNAGYRSNIEVAAAVEDAPDALPEAATAVRDAVAWLEQLVSPSSGQVARQFRDMKAVFASRPAPQIRQRLQFVGLPSVAGFPALAESGEHVRQLTIASPFWPSGLDPADVVSALVLRCGGQLGTVRLIGPADIDEQGRARPIIPAGLVRALIAAGAKVDVAAADPDFGCTAANEDDEGEFDQVAQRRIPALNGNRSLHAKALLAKGDKTTRLAIGSFNLTRKGLGLVSSGNAEAGLLWALPTAQASGLADVVSFATGWRKVTRAPEEFVVEPEAYDGDENGGWPVFLVSLRAKRDGLLLEGDAATWPPEVKIRMRDIRARLAHRDEWFDPWLVKAPSTSGAGGAFTVSLPLAAASWLDQAAIAAQDRWPLLPDLEAEVTWPQGTAMVPVLFEDKHLFPVVESQAREDEQSLIAWFLGLRPAGEQEDGGFGHSIDPLPERRENQSATRDILSYLVRDFVHALPGIRNRLADAGLTETGLRAALLGHRSPVELAQESVRAYLKPRLGRPRKTAVATAFQLVELRHLVETVPLPDLADGVVDELRTETVAIIAGLLDQVVADLAPADRSAVLCDYLAGKREVS